MDRAAQIKVAEKYLKNVDLIAVACDRAGLPFHVACALVERESGGLNVYGHDKGGALSGFNLEVNEANFKVFEWIVFDQGQQSNGVGPCQLTYRGFFTDMKKKGLKPWDALDNMTYGMGLLAGYYAKSGSWLKAGKAYNGSTAYGLGLSKGVLSWKKRLA